MVWPAKKYWIWAVIGLLAMAVLYEIMQLYRRRMKKPVDTLSTSIKGRNLIKSHESLRLKTYDDARPNLVISAGYKPSGTLTIGWGHTGPDVYAGQEITKAQAQALFDQDILEAEAIVKRNVKVPISQNQFDALTSFSFNIGNRSREIWQLVNSGASNVEVVQWLTSHWISLDGQVLGGLVKRRKEEAELFIA